jgi:O-antigen/teichoic acid export membrane protein
MSYSVAQNTSFLTLASILQKVISSVYFIIIARTIGIGNTGDYFTIIASIAVFAVVADFGFAAILTREAAQYPEKLETYMRAIFGTKLVFGVITFGLIIGSKMIFNYPSQPFPLVYLAGLTMFFDNLQTTFYGALRSRKNLLYEALGIILSQALTLSIGTLVILNHWPLMWLIAAYTIPSFIINLYSALIIRIKYKFSLIPTFNWNVFKSFFIMAWPFALAGIISRFYAYNDSIIMTKVLTQNQIGAWAAAYKVAAAFQFIPITLSVSVFPAMSSLALLNKQKVVEAYREGTKGKVSA